MHSTIHKDELRDTILTPHTNEILHLGLLRSSKQYYVCDRVHVCTIYLNSCLIAFHCT